MVKPDTHSIVSAHQYLACLLNIIMMLLGNGNCTKEYWARCVINLRKLTTALLLHLQKVYDRGLLLQSFMCGGLTEHEIFVSDPYG